MKRKATLIASVCLAVALVTLSVVSCAEPTPTGGVLKVCDSIDATALGDPTVYSTLPKISPCVETLLSADEAGMFQPHLVTAWEEDPDALTITLHLREGVKFHDGTDFNAEAVKYNLDRFCASPHPFISSVESVEVIDDYTVQLSLSPWDSTLLGTLAMYPGQIVSRIAMETNGPEWAETHPVGTGPFKFVSWERDVAIKYERFDDYWGGKPYLDGIEFHIIADSMVRLAAFERGEVDVLFNVSPKDAHDMEESGRYNLNLGLGMGLGFRALSGDATNPDSPFADVRVRQAVGCAVNTQEICDALGYGYWLPTNQPVYKGYRDYNSDIVGYSYNPERARELLAEAGYPDGFKTTLLTSVRYASTDVSTAIQSYLAEVGIDAEIDLCEAGRYNQYIFHGWQKNALIVVSFGQRTDAALLLKLQLVSWAPVWPNMLRLDEIDNLTTKAMAARDLDSKKAFSDQALKLAMDEQCVLNPLYQTTSVIAMHPQFHDEGIFDAACAGEILWRRAWLER